MGPLSAQTVPTCANGVCDASLPACRLSLQPSLLRAIFNVDPDEVRSLILKKEDVNVQVSLVDSALPSLRSDYVPV